MPTSPTGEDQHELESDEPDRLLSVDEISLRWRIGINDISPLVIDGSIPSLDGGRLAAAGRTDIACVRQSWAESVRVDSPGAVRRIDLAFAPGFHPAAVAALDLHEALSKRDAQAVSRLSSRASRAAADSADALMTAWLNGLGDVFSDDTGITSGVYDLAPFDAVGVRIAAEVGPIPEIVDRATPKMMAGALVFLEEDGGWFADLPLSTSGENWLELMASAPPS